MSTTTFRVGLAEIVETVAARHAGAPPNPALQPKPKPDALVRAIETLVAEVEATRATVRALQLRIESLEHKARERRDGAA